MDYVMWLLKRYGLYNSYSEIRNNMPCFYTKHALIEE